MSKLTLIALCRSAALAAALGSCLVACPRTSAAASAVAPKAPEPVAEVPLELKPEDAGRAAGPRHAASQGHGKKSGGLAACCKALRQNAASAPEPNKGYRSRRPGSAIWRPLRAKTRPAWWH